MLSVTSDKMVGPIKLPDSYPGTYLSCMYDFISTTRQSVCYITFNQNVLRGGLKATTIFLPSSSSLAPLSTPDRTSLCILSFACAANKNIR